MIKHQIIKDPLSKLSRNFIQEVFENDNKDNLMRAKRKERTSKLDSLKFRKKLDDFLTEDKDKNVKLVKLDNFYDDMLEEYKIINKKHNSVVRDRKIKISQPQQSKLHFPVNNNTENNDNISKLRNLKYYNTNKTNYDAILKALDSQLQQKYNSSIQHELTSISPDKHQSVLLSKKGKIDNNTNVTNNKNFKNKNDNSIDIINKIFNSSNTNLNNNNNNHTSNYYAYEGINFSNKYNNSIKNDNKLTLLNDDKYFDFNSNESNDQYNKSKLKNGMSGMNEIKKNSFIKEKQSISPNFKNRNNYIIEKSLRNSKSPNKCDKRMFKTYIQKNQNMMMFNKLNFKNNCNNINNNNTISNENNSRIRSVLFDVNKDKNNSNSKSMNKMNTIKSNISNINRYSSINSNMLPPNNKSTNKSNYMSTHNNFIVKDSKSNSINKQQICKELSVNNFSKANSKIKIVNMEEMKQDSNARIINKESKDVVKLIKMKNKSSDSFSKSMIIDNDSINKNHNINRIIDDNNAKDGKKKKLFGCLPICY